jgi:hypothetical protein
MHLAGDNQKELKAVISHYNQKPQDSLKLKAAIFLIENMPLKYFYDGKQLHQWDSLFVILDKTPDDWKLNQPWYSKEVSPYFERLASRYGKLDFKQMDQLFDVKVISAKYLIENIDLAFEAWKKPWNKHLTWNQFCEYILPYRAFHELLERWRPDYILKFRWVLDSARNPNDIYEVATAIGQKTALTYNDAFMEYPVPISPQNLLKSHFGLCRDLTCYTTLAMRAMGIPVAIDYVPFWGNDDGGHFWNAILDTTGKMIPLRKEMDKGNAQKAFSNKLAKVYRKTYAVQERNSDFLEATKMDVPDLFKDLFYKDVTSEYVPVSDVLINLQSKPPFAKYAYICTFRSRTWEPIDYAQIQNNKVVFKNVGRGVVYIVMYYHSNELIPASDHFLVCDNGKTKILRDRQSVHQKFNLTRKFSEGDWKIDWRKCLINAKFQGANRSDFADAVTLAKIDKLPPDHEDTIMISDKKGFRYFRLLFPQPNSNENVDASVAEIELYDLNKKKLTGESIGTKGCAYNIYLPSKAFDSDILSFYEDATDSKTKYVGLGLKKGTTLSKIVYCARNDKNCIRPGDLYELEFWRNGSFYSLGQRKAKDYSLMYENVPSGGLYWLRNLSEGKEERIFTYENGKQVWW